MLRLLKARRKALEVKSDWSVPQTPHYSEGLQEIKDGFYEIFENDPYYNRLDFNEKRQFAVAPEVEGVEEVLRFWPKADLLREPDPEPFGEFPDLELSQ